MSKIKTEAEKAARIAKMWRHVGKPVARFSYTPAEVDHLRGCIELAWEHIALAGHYDAGYFRYLATMADAPDHGDYGPSATDCEEPSVAELLEQADAMECGFVGGEELI